MGLEAGPLSHWLCSGLAEAGLPAICVETRHMRAVFRAQSPVNKTDRNDARGIAADDAGRLVSSGACEDASAARRSRMLLTHRKITAGEGHRHRERSARDAAQLRPQGWDRWRGNSFEPRMRELVERIPDIAASVEPMLIVRRVLREQIGGSASAGSGHCPRRRRRAGV